MSVSMCRNDYLSDNHVVTINDQKLSIGDLSLASGRVVEYSPVHKKPL